MNFVAKVTVIFKFGYGSPDQFSVIEEINIFKFSVLSLKSGLPKLRLGQGQRDLLSPVSRKEITFLKL